MEKRFSSSLYLIILIALIPGYTFSQFPDSAGLYRIAETIDVRQRIDPGGLIHFQMPFRYVHSLAETQDFVFAVSSRHLAVYYKEQEYWRLFTWSDGYLALKSLAEQVDYDHYFVMKGASFTDPQKEVILVYDKRRDELFSLTSEALERRQTQWARQAPYQNPGHEWYLDQGPDVAVIKRRNKKDGQVSVFHCGFGKMNTITGIVKTGAQTFVASQEGLRVFDPDGHGTYYSSRDLLFRDEIDGLATDGERLALSYGDAVDVFRAGDMQRLQRVQTNTEIQVFQIVDQYLFYANGSVLMIHDLTADRQVDSLVLNDRITGIFSMQHSALIFTRAGYSVFDPESRKVSHFLENDIQSASEEEGYDERGYDKVYEVAGRFQGQLVVISRCVDGSCAELLTIEPATLTLTPVEEQNPLAGLLPLFTRADRCFLQEDLLIVYSDHRLRLYALNLITSAFPIPPADTLRIEDRKKFRQIPSVLASELDFPSGKEVFHAVINGSTLWFATDQGLFSHDLENHKMKSHLLSSPVIHSSTELIVTDEAIYSHGYWNAGISWPWSRIDRDDFQLRFYSGDRFDLPAGSAKLRNDTLIYAGPAGLYIHDLKNDRIDLFETGNPPGQVAFKKDHFLAADDTAVFEFGRTSELMATYPFPEPLPRSKWRPAPEKMETDGAVIWLTALEGLKGQLIRFDPGENTWRTWPIKDPYGRVIDLFVEEAFIWVISHQNIYRYDKKRGELEKLGAIFHEKTDSTLASTLYIRDAYDQGASIYLAGDEGVYELTKSTLEVKKSGLDLFDHFHTNQITAEGAFFFLAMDDGILQLPRKMLAESFVSREGFKLYKRE